MRTTIFTFAGILLVILALLYFIKGVNSSGESVGTDSGTVVQQNQNRAGTALPAPPEELILNLFNTCDFIDYIFYDYNFSLSVEEPESVKGSVTYLSTTPVTDMRCTKASGKIFYKSDGETLYEADLHFGKACAFIVLLNADRKPAYACKMSDAGVTNLTKLLASVNVSPK